MKGFKDWFISKHGFWPATQHELVSDVLSRLCDAVSEFVTQTCGITITATDRASLVPAKLFYKNYRGEFSERTITPICPWYGSTPWHPEPQWLLRAYDHDKGAERDFALKDFNTRPAPAATDTGLATFSVEVTSSGHPYMKSDPDGDYVTRSQADELLAAERAEKEKLEAAWLEAEGIISDLKAKLSAAEKALEPFADIADLIDAETEGMAETDELVLHFHDYEFAKWPVSLFRKARAVLGGKP